MAEAPTMCGRERSSCVGIQTLGAGGATLEEVCRDDRVGYVCFTGNRKT